ncbi:MAG: trypsin-like peptidase domain-containing protein [Planctomycetes bacterium]|nr:trypsin-like peptidase domain-containing protein [Planctomycetota bacterium]
MPRFKKLAGFDAIPFLRIADSDAISPTEKIAVMGYPEDSDDMRVKAANLSGRQYLGSFWELIGGFQFLEVATASAVQSGNSGGAAVTAAGDLVGIPARGDWTDRTGWLIPSNVLLRFLDEVAANDQGRRKLDLLSLGILTEKTFPGMAVLAGMPEDFVDNEVGITVQKVSKGSLAEEWGLRGGDILLGFRNPERNIHVYMDFEGKVKTTGAMKVFPAETGPLDNSLAPRRNLSELILMSRPGQEVELIFVRKGLPGIQSLRKKLVYREVLKVPHLGTFEVPDFVEWAGMILQGFHDGNVGRESYYYLGPLLAEGAVVVTHTDSGSLAPERGLSPGHTVSAVNGMRVRGLPELREVLKKVNDAYDAWTKEPGFSPQRARYDPRNYAVIRYHVWDEERSELVQREVDVPIEEARAVGRSLDGGGE